MQIERYFSSLPKECVPLKGSEGAKWRVLAFFRQWPAHDSSLEACHSMEDIEQKRMTKFVTRRKRKFFGIGEVHLLISQDNKVCVYIRIGVCVGVCVCVRVFKGHSLFIPNEY